MKNFIQRTLNFYLLLLLLVSVMNCTRVINEPMASEPLEDDPNDPYDEKLMEYVGTLPSVNYGLDELMLPNGQIVSDFLKENDPEFLENYQRGARVSAETGPQQKKNLLLARMSAIARKLCDRDKLYEKGSQPNEPEQHGLGYSYGQRNYKERLQPAAANCCQMYKIYGLDCSGLLYNVLKESGYDPGLPVWAEKMRKVNFWEELFSKDAELSKVTIQDLGPTANLQEGDILYWYKTPESKKASHIGIVLKTKEGKLGIFQSNGGPPCSACESKFGASRGCRQIPLSGTAWFGKKWGALRLVTDITGKWQMQLKCDWAEDDNVAVIFDIEFAGKQDSNNMIEILGKGAGKDYDGSDLYVDFKGSYDPVKNILTGRFYITNDDQSGSVRMDDIYVQLDNDDTGFVSLTNIQRDEGTCLSEAKLINLTGSKNGRLSMPKVKLTRQSIFAARK